MGLNSSLIVFDYVSVTVFNCSKSIPTLPQKGTVLFEFAITHLHFVESLIVFDGLLLSDIFYCNMDGI